MNWEAIGAAGEIVGAFAVVVTLFYLARQTSQNTKAILSESRSKFAWGGAEQWDELAKDSELRALYKKSLSEPPESFSESEWFQFCLMARAQVMRNYDAWSHGINDIGPSEVSDLWINSMSAQLKAPAWKKYWIEEVRGAPQLEAYWKAVEAAKGVATLEFEKN